MTGGSFVTWRKVPNKIQLLPSHRHGEIGVLSSSMFTFQRDGAQVLEEVIPRLQATEGQVTKVLLVFRRIYIHFKEMRKYLKLQVF